RFPASCLAGIARNSLRRNDQLRRTRPARWRSKGDTRRRWGVCGQPDRSRNSVSSGCEIGWVPVGLPLGCRAQACPACQGGKVLSADRPAERRFTAAILFANEVIDDFK